MKIKIIRFGSKSSNAKKYSQDLYNLSKTQTDIYIRIRQKPYLAILEKNKLVACLWLEKDSDENDFSIITHPKYRNRGYASMLVRELVHDRFVGKITSELCCEPINPTMRKIIKKYKFSPDFRNSDFWTFDI